MTSMVRCWLAGKCGGGTLLPVFKVIRWHVLTVVSSMPVPEYEATP